MVPSYLKHTSGASFQFRSPVNQTEGVTIAIQADKQTLLIKLVRLISLVPTLNRKKIKEFK